MMKHKIDSLDVGSAAAPGPWARSVSYDAATDTVKLMLETGTTVVIPRDKIDELRDIPVSHMGELKVVADGEVLTLRADDVDIFVPGLLWDLVGFNAPVACWSGDTPAGTGRAAPQRPA
jgi:hypothetical protein